MDDLIADALRAKSNDQLAELAGGFRGKPDSETVYRTMLETMVRNRLALGRLTPDQVLAA